MTATQTELPPVTPRRFANYVRFYISFLAILALITSTLPISSDLLSFVPAYASLSRPLGLFTSMFCLLILAFIFFLRHSLARWMFSDRLSGRHAKGVSMASLVFILMTSSLISVFLYLGLISHSATQALGERKQIFLDAATQAATVVPQATPDPSLLPYPYTALALADTPLHRIPHPVLLSIFYLGIFLPASAALILMATKEYLQDILGIDDKSLITQAGGIDGMQEQIGTDSSNSHYA
jgi:hypothetical protein